MNELIEEKYIIMIKKMPNCLKNFFACDLKMYESAKLLKVSQDKAAKLLRDYKDEATKLLKDS